MLLRLLSKKEKMTLIETEAIRFKAYKYDGK
jgi:hypothetical protein